MNRFVIMPSLYAKKGLKITDPFLRTLLALPPEVTAFYCDADFARQNNTLITHLMNHKTDVQIGTLKGLGPDCFVLSDHYNKHHTIEIFTKVRETGAKILFYQDYTEETGYLPAKDEFFIFSSETQLFFSMLNCFYSLDAAGHPEVGLVNDGGEGVAVGILRADDITIGHDESREVLREKLMAAIKIELSDRPLALHFSNHNLDSAPVEASLKKLAEHCDVLIKHHEDAESSFVKVEGPGIYHYYSPYASSDHHISYLARYAADAVLTGCFSGAMPTTLMMGARVIPIYTQKVFATGSARQKGMYSSFARELRMPFRMITSLITDQLPPICVEATEMLLARIDDTRYWAEYKKELPQIQKAALGHYYLGEAALKRVQGFIIRLIKHGSFVNREGGEQQKVVKLNHSPYYGSAMVI